MLVYLLQAFKFKLFDNNQRWCILWPPSSWIFVSIVEDFIIQKKWLSMKISVYSFYLHCLSILRILLYYSFKIHWGKPDWGRHQKCIPRSTRFDSSVSLCCYILCIKSNILRNEVTKLYRCIFLSTCFCFRSLANNKMKVLPRNLFFDLDSLLELWVSNCNKSCWEEFSTLQADSGCACLKPYVLQITICSW